MEFKNSSKNKAKYTSNMRNFIASTIVSSIDTQYPAEWKENTAYKVGDLVRSDNKVYISTTSGTSGLVQPTHTSGIQTIGKNTWLFVKNAINSNNLNSNLYLGLGGTKPWVNDDYPPEVSPSDNSMSDAVNDMLTLIRIDGTGCRFGLKRNIWVQNTKYDEYDPNLDLDDALSYPNGFYVITSTFDVYKCISNNNGANSIIEPIGQSVNSFSTSDGYVWKYMASIDRSDISRFITNDYIPISVKLFDDGSNQWKVQENAKNGSIGTFNNIQTKGSFTKTPSYSIVGTGKDCIPIIDINEVGQIDKINTFDGGSAYNDGTYITLFESTATGDGAILTANLSNGSISDITIENGGNGYAIEPSIFVVGDGTGAQISVTINSSNGSINNASIVNAGIDYTYIKIIVVKGTNAGYADAVLSPTGGHGKNVVTELGSRSIIFSCKNTPEMSPYLLSGENSTYRQISLLTNVSSTNNTTPNLLIGNSHPNSNSETLDKFDADTGLVLWIDNRTPITRSQQQEEYIKIVLDI